MQKSFLATSLLPLLMSGSMPSSAAVPTFQATSEVVYVPVVVKDKHGAHLPGLQKESFRIEQDGKEQPIAVFEEIRDTEAAPAAPAPESPDTITNYSVADQNPRRVLIIVLDMLNTPQRNQRRAKEALIKFLARSVPKDEPIALLSFDSKGLKQLHPFTSDTAALIAAMQKVASRLGVADTPPPDAPKASDPTDADEAMIVQWESDAIATETTFRQKDVIRSTLMAMQQVAGAFAGLPGRKALIWATDGFPFTLQDPHTLTGLDTDMADSYETTWRLLSSANIAVYPVKLDGLSTIPMFSAAQSRPMGSSRGGGGRGGLGAPPPLPYDPGGERDEAMRSFASETGGRAFLNSNDVEKGFAEAARDSHSYYLLGYSPQGENKAGWHKIKVQVQAPHGDVRAREGFYVGNADTTPNARNHELAVALSAPVDYTGIHFGLKMVEPTAADTSLPKEAKRKVRFKLMVPARSITIDRQHGNAYDLDLTAVAVTATGHTAGQARGHSHSTIQSESPETVMRSELALKAGLEVPPGEYELRVALRDTSSGKLGTLRSTIVVQ